MNMEEALRHARNLSPISDESESENLSQSNSDSALRHVQNLSPISEGIADVI